MRPAVIAHRQARLLLSLSLLVVAVVAASPSPAAAPDRQIRVMSYNIRHGQGMDDRLDLNRIAGEIRDSGAGIVALQEVDRHWGERSEFADQATELARALKMHLVYGANLDRDPVREGQPRRQYGTAILSDWPIKEWRSTLLPRTGDLEQRGLLEALIDVRGAPVRVFNTHLQHDSQAERVRQIDAIRKLIGVAQEPVVLAGDLNAGPDTPEVDALTDRLTDVWTEAGTGPGYTIAAESFSARFDYVLHSDDIVAPSAVVLATQGSDHQPVVTDLTVRVRHGGEEAARP